MLLLTSFRILFFIFLACGLSGTYGKSVARIGENKQAQFDLLELNSINVNETNNNGPVTFSNEAASDCHLRYCLETGGVCGENECICPSDTKYYINVGCQATNRCDLNLCLETGGACGIIEGVEECTCPSHTTYYLNVGCQVPTKVCDEKVPKCKVTGGDCIVKENLIQCICPDRNYSPNSGCQEECSVVKCENDGECIIQNGTEICNCTNGYTGKFCEISLKEECNARLPKCIGTGGSCWWREENDIYEDKDFGCTCPYYTYYEQDEGCKVFETFCKDLIEYCLETGGYCVAVNNTNFECRCPKYAEYKDGIGCQKECSVVKCENNGECIIRNGTEICNCTKGYEGKFCEIDSLNEECNARRPKCIETGGSCSDGMNPHDEDKWEGSKDEYFKCSCPDYTHYEQDQGCIASREKCPVFKPNCQETGGSCLSDKNGIIYCKCPNYTTYDRDTGCQLFEDDCQELIKYCSETGGSCVTVNNTKAECRCPKYAEYKIGIGCQSSVEFCNSHKPNCVETGGVCVFQKYNLFQCRCPNNTVYDRNAGCQGPCSNEPCQNGGECVITRKSFECICRHPFRGKFCEIGREDNFDVCTENLCKNGGTCRVIQGKAKCFCMEPYGGTFCDTRMDDCFTNICNNGGICRRINGEPKCFCMEPYGGKFCDSRTGFSRNTIIYAVLLALLSLVVISGICTMCYRNCVARRN